MQLRSYRSGIHEPLILGIKSKIRYRHPPQLSPWNPDKDDDWNVILALQAAVEEQGKTISLEKCQQFYTDNKNWHDDTGAQIVYWLRTSAYTVWSKIIIKLSTVE